MKVNEIITLRKKIGLLRECIFVLFPNLLSVTANIKLYTGKLKSYLLLCVGVKRGPLTRRIKHMLKLYSAEDNVSYKQAGRKRKLHKTCIVILICQQRCMG